MNADLNTITINGIEYVQRIFYSVSVVKSKE